MRVERGARTTAEPAAARLGRAIADPGALTAVPRLSERARQHGVHHLYSSFGETLCECT